MKIDEEKLIRETRLCIYNSMEVDKSMYALFNYLKKYFPVNLIFTPVFDTETKSLRYLSLATDKGALLVVMSHQISIESQRFLFEIRNKVTMFNKPDGVPPIQELRSFFKKNPYFDMTEAFSTLAIPLKRQGPLYGGFGLLAAGENRYNEDHKKLIQLLRKPLSNAITNLFRFREIITVDGEFSSGRPDFRKRSWAEGSVQVVGAESGLKHVMDLVMHVAPLTSPVLIQGETGVGKEIIAQAIHGFSDRSAKPMVSVNCGAIPETLIESELFGHVRGAFTGALADKKGYFEQADGGTIFLDEVGELSQQAQVKLLRVLQNMEIHRVGANHPVTVDVRVVAATNQGLQNMVREKKFREDLWYRLNVFPIDVPPLRERKEDIPLLAEYFVMQNAKAMNFIRVPEFDVSSFRQLAEYDWPGNVRELQNVVQRAVILSGNRPLSFQHLLQDPVARASSAGDPSLYGSEALQTLDQVIAAHIRKTLSLCNGRIEGKGGAADCLGLNPSTLRSKMRKLAIPYGRDLKGALRPG